MQIEFINVYQQIKFKNVYFKQFKFQNSLRQKNVLNLEFL